jgi:hypothetical protein
VFERLFGDGGTPTQRLAQMQRRRSLLDSVSDDMARLERSVGPADRARIAEYLDAVREIERRIQKAEERHGDAAAPALDRPLGIPDRFDEHVRLMFDLVWLAYQGDITRVITFMFGRELSSRTYPEIGISDPHHGLSHHRDDPGQIAKLAKLNTFQSELFASFLEKMHATPDGDGTLLDHSLLMYGAGLSNPNIHSHVDLPTALIGGASGRLAGNRHMIVPLEAETSKMSNLLLSVMDKAGIHAERFGDSTGPFALDATGSPMAGL